MMRASSGACALREVGLLTVETQGRHRYFRIADADAAHLVESLMGVAFGTGAGAVRVRSSPREPALRKARVCYDHLAGELGVLVYESLARRGAFALDAGGVTLTDAGRALVAGLGIDPLPAATRRPLCRHCLDWSERRHHLAGALGTALLERFQQLGWAHRVPGSRVLAFSADGEAALRAWLD